MLYVGGALVFEVSSTPGGYVNPIHGFHISRGVLNFGLDGGVPSAVVDTTFVDIYVDTKNIPTCRYNIQHIDKRTMEHKMSIIICKAAMSYATTFK